MIFFTEVAVVDFLHEPGDRALYTYDYGDEWRHDVLCQGNLSERAGKEVSDLPGRRIGRPAGGLRRDSRLLRLRQGRKERDNSEDRLTWLGRWRPDRFDPPRVKFWSPLRRLKIALKN